MHKLFFLKVWKSACFELIFEWVKVVDTVP